MLPFATKAELGGPDVRFRGRGGVGWTRDAGEARGSLFGRPERLVEQNSFSLSDNATFMARPETDGGRTLEAT